MTHRARVADAARWIPDTFYLQNCADSRDIVVAGFDEDLDPATATLAGARIEGRHMTKWREEWISLKWRGDKGATAPRR